MTTTPLAFDTTDAYLLSIRDQIAELRRTRCDLTAGIMRDALLCQIEAWVDPIGLDVRAEWQDEQRAKARKIAAELDLAFAPF